MPRKGPVPRREIPPDYLYGSVLVHKLINKVMTRGKKSLAERICYQTLEIVQEKSGKKALEVFEKAVENVKPKVMVKSRRVGGATYQVPVEVLPHQQTSIALRWIVSSARTRPGKSMVEKLANELLDAYHGEGGAFKKKEEAHRVAEANRAFAHYRW